MASVHRFAYAGLASHGPHKDCVAAAERSLAMSHSSTREKFVGRGLSWALLAFVLMCASAHAQTISTFAGGFTGDGGQASSASMKATESVAVDSSGNVYIADANNNRIRKVAANGIITTFAGNGSPGFSGDGGLATSAQLHDPTAVVVDSSGNVFIADKNNDRIRKVAMNGVITTFAGNGTGGFSGDGGPAASAQLQGPAAVAVDSSGNVYITDQDNHRIRKVATNGIITTFAGNGTGGFSGDGNLATSAQLNFPEGVAVDSTGNVYIGDASNNRIRKVATDGIITTFAGNGTSGSSGDGGQATSAQLNYPNGVAVDSSGNIYIADIFTQRIRKVATNGIITTFAGNGSPGFSGDGSLATSAQLQDPFAVAVDSAGNVFIADTANHCVRKVATNGIIETFAGSSSYPNDGGAATSAELFLPAGMAADSAGNVYVADTNNQRIRKVDTGGVITTFAGDGTYGFSGDGGPATSAKLAYPNGVAVDSMGNVYIADRSNRRVRKVDTNGIITTFAGNGTSGSSGDGGPATSAQLMFPAGVAVDSTGNVYIADRSNRRIRKVDTNGVITAFAGNGSPGYSGDGGPATSAQLNFPAGVTVDSTRNVYIADSVNNRIRKVDTNGTITTFAGNGSPGHSGDGGPATSAQLNFPAGVAIGSTGNVYIADGANNRIRKVNTNGMITTLAGTDNPGYSGDGGPARSAELNGPAGVAVDSVGYLYIADSANHLVRTLNLDKVFKDGFE